MATLTTAQLITETEQILSHANHAEVSAFFERRHIPVFLMEEGQNHLNNLKMDLHDRNQYGRDSKQKTREKNQLKQEARDLGEAMKTMIRARFPKDPRVLDILETQDQAFGRNRRKKTITQAVIAQPSTENAENAKPAKRKHSRETNLMRAYIRQAEGLLRLGQPYADLLTRYGYPPDRLSALIQTFEKVLEARNAQREATANRGQSIISRNHNDADLRRWRRLFRCEVLNALKKEPEASRIYLQRLLRIYPRSRSAQIDAVADFGQDSNKEELQESELTGKLNEFTTEPERTPASTNETKSDEIGKLENELPPQRCPNSVMNQDRPLFQRVKTNHDLFQDPQKE